MEKDNDIIAFARLRSKSKDPHLRRINTEHKKEGGYVALYENGGFRQGRSLCGYHDLSKHLKGLSGPMCHDMYIIACFYICFMKFGF